MEPRVLVADDSPAIVRVIEMTLGRSCQVVGYTDAVSAFEAGTADDWDVAFVDVSMPHMSGLEIAAAWRRRGRPFPVIVMSGHEVPTGGAPEGVTAWATKPFDPPSIRALVETHALRPSACGASRPV